jgi:hypothetical protein
MKMPVGPLGMTDEERADLFRTGKLPERTIDVPESPLGFSLNGWSAPLPPKPPDHELPDPNELAEGLRYLLRLEGREEGRKDALRAQVAGGKRGGHRSGEVRSWRNKPWAPHAIELAKTIVGELPNASDGTVALEIVTRWKLEKLPPSVRTLEKVVSELRKTGELPTRAK